MIGKIKFKKRQIAALFILIFPLIIAAIIRFVADWITYGLIWLVTKLPLELNKPEKVEFKI